MKKVSSNNKGFSLVELIIVIAIMAILVGVLAPQYLKYVEKSRKSTDADNVQAFQSAVQTMASDEQDYGVMTAGTLVITFTTTNVSVTGANNGAATSAFQSIISSDWASQKLKSGKWGTGGIVLNATFDNNGTVTFSSTNSSYNDYTAQK